jgi:hypothetical protein
MQFDVVWIANKAARCSVLKYPMEGKYPYLQACSNK